MIEWRDIPGFDGYQASNTGLIRSFWKRNAGPYPKKVEEPTNLSQLKNKKGYFRVKILGNTESVHKLVALAFSGLPEPGQVCRHLDGNQSNNHAYNLKWGTSQENAEDSIAHGTMQMGESHYASRLTQNDVDAIRSSDKTDRELAEVYGVTSDHIYKIRTFEKWRGDRDIGRKGYAKKLTDEQVKEIRESPLLQRELAEKYGVVQTTISKIKLNKTRTKKEN